MTLITSPQNPRLKQLRKLQRARERARTGLFAVEGEDLVGCAHHAGRTAVEGFGVPGLDVVQEGFSEVDPKVLAAVSTLGSGTRAIAVYEQRWGPPTGPLCVYLHRVRDPGNVGTVLRSAHAFGASCVALGPGCADPHSPKAVRASMGAVFFVQLARVEHVSELPGERIALVAGSGEPLWGVGEDIAESGPRARTRTRARGGVSEGQQCDAVTLIVGSERDGLPQELVGECERVAHIPICADSLNAAMACTVALYEISRRSTRVPT